MTSSHSGKNNSLFSRLGEWYAKQPNNIKVVVIGAVFTGTFGCMTTLLGGILGWFPTIYENLTEKTTPPSQITLTVTEPIEYPVRLDLDGTDAIEPCTKEFSPIILPEDIDPVQDPVYALSEITTRDIDSIDVAGKELLNLTAVQLTITSIVSDEWVRISNKVFVRVINHDPLPETLNAIDFFCAGAGKTREFPVVKVSGSGQTEFSQTLPDIDFFSLQPGEFEVFDVSVSATEIGYYELVIGVEYSYGGKTNIIWTDHPIYLYTPQEVNVWMRTPPDILQLFSVGQFVNGQYNYVKNESFTP